jgi:Xaa-Pro aminopeptidase
MDVHDAGLYLLKGASQKLVPGMVLTVEPARTSGLPTTCPTSSGTSAFASKTTCSSPRTGIENLTLGAPKT